jgi:hypothetical protein
MRNDSLKIETKQSTSYTEDASSGEQAGDQANGPAKDPVELTSILKGDMLHAVLCTSS